MATIKTRKEIELIKKACTITDKIFSSVIQDFTFATEIELAQYIGEKAASYGCKNSFGMIVAACENASEPHHEPTSRKLEGFVVIDFGVIYKRYMSDMTRTVYVGTPSAHEKNIYAILLKSQIAAIRMIKHGTSCRDAHNTASSVLGKFDKYFIHSLGHGIGTKIHERPRIRKKSKYYLKENMVITVEPGIYMKGKLGLRIEDTCLVGKQSCEPLTHSTKDLIVI